MRKLLIGLAVLAVLLVAADFAVKAVAESQAATALQRSLKLSSKPSVSLGGFPFLLHLTSGSFGSVGLKDDDFSAEGIRIREADIDLRDVRFSTGELISGSGGDIRIAGGSGTAALDGAALSAALRHQGVPVTVRFSGDRAVLSSSQLPGRVAGRLSVRNGALVFSSSQVPQGFSLDLPTIVPGIHYTGVRIEGAAAVLSFDVERQTVHV
jgi:LmeA-like phospholipid-binding